MKTVAQIRRNITTLTRGAAQFTAAAQIVLCDVVAHHLRHGGAELASELVAGMTGRHAKTMAEWLTKHGPFIGTGDGPAFDKAKRTKVCPGWAGEGAIDAYVATLPCWASVKFKAPAAPKAAPELGELINTFTSKLRSFDEPAAQRLAGAIAAEWAAIMRDAEIADLRAAGVGSPADHASQVATRTIVQAQASAAVAHGLASVAAL